MAKWSGKIGFASLTNSAPGVWKETIIEKSYYGDLIKNFRKLDDESQINDSVNISNQISFISDPYALNNFFKIRYITCFGSKWKVSSIEVQYPRLIASLGDLYNEQN